MTEECFRGEKKGVPQQISFRHWKFCLKNNHFQVAFGKDEDMKNMEMYPSTNRCSAFQLCYSTVSGLKVDWRKHRKTTVVCNTGSGRIISPRAAKFNTARGKVQGKAHASFGRAVSRRRPDPDISQMSRARTKDGGERNRGRDSGVHISQGTARCCSDRIVFSEKG